MTAPFCRRCGYRHHPAMTTADGRFNRNIPTTYRSTHAKDTPVRDSRRDAEADHCRYLAEARRVANELFGDQTCHLCGAEHPGATCTPATLLEEM